MASTGPLFAVPASSAPSPSGKQHGLVQFGQPGAQVHSPALQQPGGEAEPDGGVVVAAGQHHLGAGPGQAHQGVVEQADDVDAGQCAVIDVAGDEHDVDGTRPGRRPRAGRRRRAGRPACRRRGRTGPGASRRCAITAYSYGIGWHRQYCATTPLGAVARSAYCARFRRRSRAPRRGRGRSRPLRRPCGHRRMALGRTASLGGRRLFGRACRPASSTSSTWSDSGSARHGVVRSTAAAARCEPGRSRGKPARRWPRRPSGPPRTATAAPARPGC